MKAGQFVIGIFDGTTKPYQSKNVEKLMDEEEFNKLWRLNKPGTWIYVNPDQRVVARTVVKETNDGEYTGRKGTINHTVIVRFDESIYKDGCLYQIDASSITRELAQNTVALTQPFPEPLKQPLPEINVQGVKL